MLHCDAETLALVALGDPLDDDERRHLAMCARCQSELDQNRAVVATGRRVEPADAPQEPPAAVWDAIASELELDAEVRPFVPDADDRAERAEVIALAARRQQRQANRRRTTWFAAAASVVGIALGAVGASALTSEPTGTLIAESQLSVVPVDDGGSTLADDGLSGTARVVDSEGQDFAEVDARGLPAVDGYYEVWLIKSDLSGMISLGALTAGSQGKFTIPAGTDLSQFTIVDVSVESLDGDPTHSKESMLRGIIDA